MLENLTAQDDRLCFGFESAEQEKIFRQTFGDVICDRCWCYLRGINYVHPDIKAAKQILYDELSKANPRTDNAVY